MMRLLNGLVALTLVAGLAAAQQTNPPEPKKGETQDPPKTVEPGAKPEPKDKPGVKNVDDLAVLKGQLQELTQKRLGLLKKEQEARQKLEKNDDVQQLQKAAAEAEKVWKKALNDQLDTARKDLKEAETAYQKLVAEKIGQNKEIETIQKDIAGLDDKKADLAFKTAATELKLSHPQSPLVRKVAQDPEIIKLKQAMNFGKLDAWKAYHEAKKTRFEGMEEVKKLRAEIEADHKESKVVDKALAAATSKLSKLKSAVEHSDAPEFKEARDKMKAAAKALTAVYGDKGVRDLADQAKATRDVVQQKIAALAAGSPELADLQAQSQKLAKQIAELQLQQSKLQLEKLKKNQSGG